MSDESPRANASWHRDSTVETSVSSVVAKETIKRCNRHVVVGRERRPDSRSPNTTMVGETTDDRRDPDRGPTPCVR